MKEDDVRRLLESAQRRGEPTPESRDRIRGVVREAWDDLAASPTDQGSGWYAVAAAAAAAVVVASVWMLWPAGSTDAPAPVAKVAFETGGHTVTRNGPLALPLLARGVTVETTAGGRLLVELQTGALLRVDAGTRLTLRSIADVDLARGRLFVDSAGANLTVATPNGIRIENAGTQFEVVVDAERVVVAVREGGVDLSVGDQPFHAEAKAGAGEEVVIDGRRIVGRQRVPATSRRWDWIHETMPAFELDRATVLAFLRWSAAEAGLTLEFADGRTERRAAGVTLHGPPVPASRVGRREIETTLETAPSFRVVPSDDHRLVVEWSASRSGSSRK